MKNSVFQFKIMLKNSKPAIWRRIQLPSSCTFWELHVAIQNSMGWYDCHLHQFDVVEPKTGRMLMIGIPIDDGFDDMPVEHGREHRVKDFIESNLKMNYTYDFGDDWEHSIVFEGEFPISKGVAYPVCLKGKNACPPEDVGGIWGYEDFLQAINDPNHEEHENFLQWVGGEFDPTEFSIEDVIFEEPEQHWKDMQNPF